MTPVARTVKIGFLLVMAALSGMLETRPAWAGSSTTKEATKQGLTVAVLYFDYQGKNAELEVLRKGLAQMLISDLSGQTEWKMVERDRLESLLAEQKLGRSGKLDPGTAARMGKLLGARYVVLGGYFDLMGALRVDARLVEVETGRVLGSAGMTGTAGDFLSVEQRVAQDLQKLLLDSAVALASAGGKPSPKTEPRPARVKAPAHLKIQTAVTYSQALASLDKGDKKAATAQLQKVVKDQPDFVLASLDLNRLMQ